MNHSPQPIRKTPTFTETSPSVTVIWARRSLKMMIESEHSIVRAAAGRPDVQDTQKKADGSLSVWDGVYTDEQAKRGTPLYSQFCASCHGPDLTGGEMAPALAGGDFSSN